MSETAGAARARLDCGARRWRCCPPRVTHEGGRPDRYGPTWQPPHSSRLTGSDSAPTRTTRTVSPYFSPEQRPWRPAATHRRTPVVKYSTAWSSCTTSLTMRSIAPSCSGSTRCQWVKSKRRWSGGHQRARLVHVGRPGCGAAPCAAGGSRCGSRWSARGGRLRPGAVTGALQSALARPSAAGAVRQPATANAQITVALRILHGPGSAHPPRWRPRSPHLARPPSA